MKYFESVHDNTFQSVTQTGNPNEQKILNIQEVIKLNTQINSRFG